MRGLLISLVAVFLNSLGSREASPGIEKDLPFGREQPKMRFTGSRPNLFRLSIEIKRKWRVVWLNWRETFWGFSLATTLNRTFDDSCSSSGTSLSRMQALAFDPGGFTGSGRKSQGIA